MAILSETCLNFDKKITVAPNELETSTCEYFSPAQVLSAGTALGILTQSLCNTDELLFYRTNEASAAGIPDFYRISIKASAGMRVCELTSAVTEGLHLQETPESNLYLSHGTAGDGIRDIQFDAAAVTGRSRMTILYDSGRYCGFEPERLKQCFMRVLKKVLKYPETEIQNIELVSDEEKSRITGFCGKKTDYACHSTFQEVFEQTVRENRYKIAAVYKNNAVTYEQLNGYANAIAAILRKNGTCPEKIVAVMGNKSIETLAGILGIVKAGGAYLAIDPDFPQERIREMLADCHCELLLTMSGAGTVSGLGIKEIQLDDPSIYTANAENPAVLNKPDDLLYVVYTSGTTGHPKGAMITHQNLLCIWRAWEVSYSLRKFDVRLLQLANMTFDVFTGDLARSLLSGGRIILCPEELRKNPVMLYRLIQQNQINFMESTPLMMSAFVDYLESRRLKIQSMKLLVVGADNCTVANFDKIKRFFGDGTRILNSYGISETTIDASFFEGHPDKTVSQNTPIGKPMLNVTFRILDRLGRTQPIMAEGELFICGDILGRGYLGKPDLTKEKFIRSDGCGDRMYRTGDIAKWLPDGNVSLSGRQDGQIKIRGYRIELNEIRQKLLEHPLVTDAAAAVLPQKNGAPVLCAYFIAVEKINVNDIRDFASKGLPSYMVPAFFMQMDAFPVTRNGKINRRALPLPAGLSIGEGTGPTERPVGIRSGAGDQASDVDTRLRMLIREKFGIDLFGSREIDEQALNEVGMNSITFIEIMVEIENQFGFEFDDDYMDPDKFKTLAELSNYIQDKLTHASATVPK